jgi:hypothetical protein
MPNPRPKTAHLSPLPRADNSTGRLAASGLIARVEISIDAAVRALPNRSEWLRRVITEAAQRELLSHCDGRVPRLEASGMNPSNEVES